MSGPVAQQLLSRRVFLGWLSGACAALVAVPAEAKPKPQLGVYSDVYSDRF